jgi:signal transduction histidine kinase
MPRSDGIRKRALGSLLFGALIGAANFAFDVSFPRSHPVSATTILNELIIGAAAAVLAYIWVSRQAAKQALELATEKLTQDAIERERKRIALDLHDSVCQEHTGAIMHLECALDSSRITGEAQEHLSRALQLVRGATTEMRCALWDLYPEEMRRVDIRTAIDYFARNITSGSGLNVQVFLEGPTRHLPHEVEKTLLRISQEALTNVLKHARASDVEVQLVVDAREACLSVKDNGCGFRTGTSAGGLGLASMKDRAQAVGGTWEIHTEPGRGTEVRTRIPIPVAKAVVVST